MKNFFLSIIFLQVLIIGQLSAQKANPFQSKTSTRQLMRRADSLSRIWTQNHAILVQKAKEKNLRLQFTDSSGTLYELIKIDEATGAPIYYQTYNLAAGVSTRANYLHTGGGLGLNIMGDTMTAHIWDGGIARATHQEYQSAGGSRYSVGDTSTILNSHAAHVTGTVMASGVDSLAKGMAPHSNVIGYKWDNDIAEAYTAAANGMIISNHSYGYSSSSIPDNYFGAYDGTALSWDRLAYEAPYYLMVIAGGNSGTSAVNSQPMDPAFPNFDKMSGFACSKNNLVVANAQDAVINPDGSLNSVAINTSSSQGPTDDLRIKPDITGNGTALYSTFQNSNTHYGNNTGTSMASPNIAGSLLLLQEYNHNLRNSYLKAASLKGLVLHTADDAGMTGPDAIFGWGLMNAKKAAELIVGHNTTAVIQELALANGQTYSRTFTSDNTNPLTVSISWTDKEGNVVLGLNDSTSRLVNDLDLRVTTIDSTYFPWRLSGVNTNTKGDNNKDPFELIKVNAPNGDYTITVTHKGTLVDGLQNFTSIVSGINYTYSCNPVTPTNVTLASATDHSLAVTWDMVVDASYKVLYKKSSSTIWDSTFSSTNSILISSLEAETNYDIQVFSICGSIVSAGSSIVTFMTLPPQYCTSQGVNSVDESIGRVVMHTLDNTSDTLSSGYEDFTALSTNLVKDSTYEIRVYPLWPDIPYNNGLTVYIDYNNDKIFDPISEKVLSRLPSTDTIMSGTFTVPSSAVDTFTRMRVSLKYNGNAEPCEIFDYGEVEDYSVIISSVPLSLNDIDFSGFRTDIKNSLRWIVGNPEKYNQFTLEYSENGVDFESICNVPCSQNQTFGCTHLVSGKEKYFYRLKVVHNDNAISYSNIIILREKGALKNEVLLYPNPAKDRLTVSLPHGKKLSDINYAVITDINGRQVKSFGTVIKKLEFEIQGLSSGVYFLILDGIQNEGIKFIKE